MQIKKALTSILVAGAFLVAGSAAATGSTVVGGTNDCVGCQVDNDCSACVGDIECPDVCPGLGNFTTGPDSTNRNTVDINSENYFVVENDACVTDDMMFNVDTSIGSVAGNTVVDDLSGGDIDGNVAVVHDINSGKVTIPAFSSVVAPVNMANAITGPNSTNINRVNINDTSNTEIRNNASYTGNYDFDLNTGNNTVGNNTVVGSVSTGDVSLGLTEKVSLNKNSSVVLPTISTIVVPNLANSVTGPSSTNTNTYNLNRTNEVSVINEANISNNVNANINTGNNVIEGNTCVGDVSTGSVRFNVNISSSAN